MPIAPRSWITGACRSARNTRSRSASAASWGATAARLTSAFAGMSLDEVDGLRFSAEREWVHVRASGTEPVVRVIAESPDETRTRTLIERASDALRGVHPRGKA